VGTLRVLTWNVWGRHGAHEDRQRAIIAVLRAEDPDVVFLQETWADQATDASPGVVQARQIADALGGYQIVTADGPWFSGRWLGNAVLSRFPVVRSQVRPLPRLDGGAPYRQAVIAHLDTPWGHWPVLSTHFEHRFDDTQARQLHAETLLRIVHDVRGDTPAKSLPVIIGADLNAVPDSDELHMLTGRKIGVSGVVLSDVWEHVGDGGRLGTEGHTWRADNPHTANSAWPNRRLDYVLVSWPRSRPAGNPVRSWLAGLHAVDGVHPSDHAALVVDLAVPAPEAGLTEPEAG